MSRQTAGQRWCSLVLLAVFLSLFMYYGLPTMAFRIGRSMEAGRRQTADQMADAPVDNPRPDERVAPFLRASQNVRPAVVHVAAVHSLEISSNRTAGEYPGTGHPPRISRGCGVVIDPRGFVLTSRRVVHGATRVSIVLAQHPGPFPATIVGSDAATDLAVLQFHPPAGGVAAAELTDGGEIALGDPVVAIGNAYHPGEFLWVGAVTSCGKNASAACCDTSDCIQTAAVTPWNCGAPLVNLQGAIVGINTSFRNIELVPRGLAVPAGTARQVAAQLCGQGRVTRGWLGVFINKLNPKGALRRSVGLPEGALAVSVDYVVPGSPAEAGGIRAGDMILRFGGSSFSSATELRKQIARSVPSAEAAVTLWRGEAVLDRRIMIGPQPAVPPRLPGEKEWGVRLLSQLLAEDSETTPGEIPNAVVVQEVEARSRAHELQPRDVILSVNDVPTPTLEIFCREVSRICERQGLHAVQLEVSSPGSAPRIVKLNDE